MTMFDILAVLLTLSAVFGYVNHRWLKLPRTIGLMLIAMAMSLAILGLDAVGLDVRSTAEQALESVHFSEAVLEGMLSFLLFAGALHIDLGELLKRKAVIGTMATFGVALSTALVGVSSYFAFEAVGMQIPLAHCLVFGALISPTDPIAVLAILKTIEVPKGLQVKIAGESLFNDGVAVVVFLILVRFATGDVVGPIDIAVLFLQEAVGGAAFGLTAGWLTYWLLSHVDDHQVEILLTLGLVSGAYAVAMALHLSGPIAVVIAGLVIGSKGRRLAMSEATRHHLDMFWELVDEILNAVLFVLIGLEVLLIPFGIYVIAATATAVVIALVARFIAVGSVVAVFRRFRQFPPHATRVLTWGGLRGGISVALALSLPDGPYRDPIVGVTYGVVVFSIVVQGLTIGKLVRRSQSQLLTPTED